jgi:hypothetical protein
MRPVNISSDCRRGSCPTVYDTDTDEVIVQGFLVDDPEALAHLGDLPDGEQIVRIPRHVLVEAARVLRGQP